MKQKSCNFRIKDSVVQRSSEFRRISAHV